MATKRYLQLVEKKNGKIVKNESYEIYDFFMQQGFNPLPSSKTWLEEEGYFPLSFLQRLFKKNVNKVAKYAYERGYSMGVLEVQARMNRLIVTDSEGRKKKRSKKK